MFLSQFSSNVPRNSLLQIPGIPILSGCRPNWDINPIFSIHFFYLNSCALFQLLFTPTTGYRFKSLSNVPVYIIPLSVHTTQTCNKLNYFLKRCWKCALQSLYPGSKQSQLWGWKCLDAHKPTLFQWAADSPLANVCTWYERKVLILNVF